MRDKGEAAYHLAAVLAIVALIAIIAVAVAYSAYRKSNNGVQSLRERDADHFICIVYSQLKSYALSQSNFPALTAEELHQRGVFDDQAMAFLKLRNVHFYPFSSADPDTNLVFSVMFSPGPKWHIPLKGTIEFPPFKVDLTKADILNTNINYSGLLDLDLYR